MPVQIDITSLSIGMAAAAGLAALLQVYYYSAEQRKLRRKEKELLAKYDKMKAEMLEKKKAAEKLMRESEGEKR
jgi:phosphoribosylcarboxyaminoimidazole (NCAIR) mutase